MHFSVKEARPTRTLRARHVAVAVMLLTLACVSPAWAQRVTEVPDLTGEQVFVQLTNGLATRPAGEAMALTTALEIATSPFGTSSGGFVFKLDPATGLLARTTTTFGPAFSERALTSGEGKVSVGATFSSASYDAMSDLALSRMPIGSVTASTSAASRTGTGDFKISSRTLAMSGTVGVTENFDVGVVVPLVSVKLAATTTLTTGTGVVPRIAETDNVFSGIGDVSAIAKYRFLKFKGPDLPDPGGLALLVNMRLPTGSRENLRGLGVTRTLVAGVGSFGTGRIRPHASGGFEFWSKGVDVTSNPANGEKVSVRHQVQYAAGVEVEATPKLTLLVEYLGQHIRGGGQVGLVSDTPPPTSTGITAVQSLVALPEGIRKSLLIPGLKLNVKGKMLLSLHAIVTLSNDGLRAKITPVAGINLTM